MPLLTRQEYNLILRSFDKYEVYMNSKEKELSEDLQDKLYYNLYNPKDGIAQTNTEGRTRYTYTLPGAPNNRCHVDRLF